MNQFHIANFKAFGGDAQRIPLKPLTVIFGANSSGKSSILHSLLFAHHAAKTGDLDVVYPALADETVDLGGFRQFIHGAHRGLENQLSWAADCAASALAAHLDAKRSTLNRQLGGPDSTDWQHLLAGANNLQVSLYAGIPRDNKGNSISSARPQVQRFECLVDKELILSGFAVGETTIQVDQLATDHPVVERIISTLAVAETFRLELSEAMRERITKDIDIVVPDLQIITDGFLPKKLHDARAKERSDEESDIPRPESGSIENISKSIRRTLPRMLDELVVGIADLIRQDLFSLKYLGPLRSYPPRHIAFAEADGLGSHAGGGYAWHEVAQNEALRTKVNTWLSSNDRLRTPYILKLRKYFTEGDLLGAYTDSVYDLIYDMIENLTDRVDEAWLGELEEAKETRAKAWKDHYEDEIITEEQMLEKAEPFTAMIEDYISNHTSIDWNGAIWSTKLDKQAQASATDLILVDQRTNTEVSHRDVGIGISQVLPVLVNAYGSRNQILAIEQPEIHLHPALQAELGDVFIESALGESKNRCILETHSEHLILRILRRIREESRNENPKVKATDVAVLFVQPTNGGSEIYEMEISEDGRILSPWPGGFFPERMKEMFGEM